MSASEQTQVALRSFPATVIVAGADQQAALAASVETSRAVAESVAVQASVTSDSGQQLSIEEALKAGLLQDLQDILPDDFAALTFADASITASQDGVATREQTPEIDPAMLAEITATLASLEAKMSDPSLDAAARSALFDAYNSALGAQHSLRTGDTAGAHRNMGAAHAGGAAGGVGASGTAGGLALGLAINDAQQQAIALAESLQVMDNAWSSLKEQMREAGVSDESITELDNTYQELRVAKEQGKQEQVEVISEKLESQIEELTPDFKNSPKFQEMMEAAKLQVVGARETDVEKRAARETQETSQTRDVESKAATFEVAEVSQEQEFTPTPSPSMGGNESGKVIGFSS